MLLEGRRFLVLSTLLSFTLTFAAAQEATTRILWNDPSITYSGSWYENGSASHVGGSSALTNAKDAQAVVTFSGTGISWIGLSDPWCGIAWVYLDGTLHTVDTYADTTLYQRTLFSVRGLAAGPHTLSIQVPHIRGASTSGSWVWINAFDIENGSGLAGGISAASGRTEQNGSALTYTGTWYPNSGAENSEGSAVLAVDAGSRVSITFSGTGISWIAHRDEYSGIARVYLDGVLQGLVDTYLTPAEAQSPAFAINGLADGQHSLTIEATATHNALSGGSWIWVDAFDVPGGGPGSVRGNGVVLPEGRPETPPGSAARIEENSEAVAYSGNWYRNGNPANSSSGAVLALDPGAKATVTFSGTGIKWIGTRDPWSGIARVSLDGVVQGDVDGYLAAGGAHQVIYETAGLAPGPHTLTIETTGTNNPDSKGGWIWIDAFDVTP